MISALAGHQLEFFQRVAKEGTDVSLAVNDADARPDLSPTESTRDSQWVFGVCFHITAPCNGKVAYRNTEIARSLGRAKEN